MKDVDNDGYADTSASGNCVGANTTISGRTYYKNTSNAYGWLLDAHKIYTSDCEDTSAHVQLPRNNLYIDDDQDGYAYGSSGYNDVCTSQSDSTINGRRYYKNSIGDWSWLVNLDVLGVNDCDDDDYGAWQGLTCYVDSDGDNYGTGSGSSVCGSCGAGYVTNSSDCYDSNANAKPGQTAYFTSHRGDTSFDYNCSGGNNKQYSEGGACADPLECTCEGIDWLNDKAFAAASQCGEGTWLNNKKFDSVLQRLESGSVLGEVVASFIKKVFAAEESCDYIAEFQTCGEDGPYCPPPSECFEGGGVGGSTGFTSAKACGASGTYVTDPSGGCSTTSRTQGCR